MQDERILRISVVTPSLNQAPFLERAIRSVVTQRGAFELEYLVQDRGSTDGTTEVLDRWARWIRYRVERDAGRANAINRGFLRATGDVIGWLDAEDFLYPGALARVAELFASQQDLQWVQGRCDVVHEDDRPSPRWRTAFRALRARIGSSAPPATAPGHVTESTVFWRRSALHEVGLLDEGLREGFDREYRARLSRIGTPGYIADAMAARRAVPAHIAAPIS